MTIIFPNGVMAKFHECTRYSIHKDQLILEKQVSTKDNPNLSLEYPTYDLIASIALDKIAGFIPESTNVTVFPTTKQ